MNKLSLRKIAEYTGRCISTIHRILHRTDPVTGVQDVSNAGRPFVTTEESDQALRDLALANPFVGIYGLSHLYNETAEKKVSFKTVQRRLLAAGIRAVKIPAEEEEAQDKKQYPKSKFVKKFVEVPGIPKKKRAKRKTPTPKLKRRREMGGREEDDDVSAALVVPAMSVPLPPLRKQSVKQENVMAIMAIPVEKCLGGFLPES